jgi:hypothetical protein
MAEDCPRCQRKGLPILPVLYAAVPKKAVSKTIPLSGQFGQGVADKALEQSTYVLRGLEPGYIYLLYPNNVWKGYLIDSAGYPRYYPDLTIEDMPNAIPEKSEVDACERDKHKSHYGVEAICIEEPDKIKGSVYIAYSRHKWTAQVRKTHAADPAKRMQLIAKFDGSPFPHAEVASADNLQQWVVDFNLPRQIYFNIFIEKVFKRPHLKAWDRSKHAEPLIKAMLAMSGDLKKPGLIMALHDPIGIAEALNYYRNDLMAYVLAADAEITQVDQEDMIVASTIDDLKSGITKNGGDWDRNDKHLDRAKLDPVLEKVKKRRKAAADMEARAAEFTAWMTSDGTKTAFERDFDDCSVSSSLALEDWFAGCVAGSGTCKIERDKVWQPWFDKEPTAPDNLLWKATSANQVSLLTFLAWAKIDKTFDISKGSKEIVKESDWYEHTRAVLHARAQRKAQARPYTLATEKIAQTVATQLLWLRARDRKKFLRTAAQMTTILMDRGDLILLPKTFTSRVKHYVRWQMDAWLGRPTVNAPLRLGPEGSQSPKRIGVGVKTEQDVQREVRGLEGALMVDVGKKGDDLVAFTAWVATRLKPGEAPDEKMEALLRRMKLQPSDLTLPADFKINPMTEGIFNVRNAKLDRVFSVGTAFVQLVAFVNTWSELTDEIKKGDAADKDKVLEGFASAGGAIASIIAAGMEVKGATDIILNEGVMTIAAKRLLVGAAIISLGVGLTDAYFLWRKSDKLYEEGDDDAANWTKWAARTTAASAGAAFVGSIMAICSLTGVGLVVVLSIAVLSGIAALGSYVFASQATDTELEKWLERCRFGIHYRPDSKIPYSDVNTELKALRTAIYAVVTKFDANNRSGIASELLVSKYDVTVPFYAEASKLTIEAWGIDLSSRQLKLATILFEAGSTSAQGSTDMTYDTRRNVEPKVKDRALRVTGDVTVRAPPSDAIVDDGHRCPTDYRLHKYGDNAPYVAKMWFKVAYQPDSKTWPDFTVETFG